VIPYDGDIAQLVKCFLKVLRVGCSNLGAYFMLVSNLTEGLLNGSKDAVDVFSKWIPLHSLAAINTLPVVTSEL
jgi:hypothetical protein